MLEITVRSATLQDFNELDKLANELLSLDVSPRESIFKKSLEDTSSMFFVAEIDQKIVGFIESRIFPDFVEGASIAIIQSLIVDSNYRRRDIGSKLIQKVIEEVKEHYVVELHVWVNFDNQLAEQFYKKHGFKKRSLLLEKEMV